MRIGNIYENSLIDWAGKISAVIFTKGCNFRCGYCHNPSLVIPEIFSSTPDIDEDRVINFLENRKEWLDGIVVTGGEPTIHLDLPEFIRRIRQTGLPVKIDTNGSNPQMIKNLIKDRLIDFISMDIKTILTPGDYQLITNCNDPGMINKIEESITILRTSGIQYQFRTTLLPYLHTENIILILKNRFKNDPHIFQNYRNGVNVESYNKSILSSP